MFRKLKNLSKNKFWGQLKLRNQRFFNQQVNMKIDLEEKEEKKITKSDFLLMLEKLIDGDKNVEVLQKIRTMSIQDYLKTLEEIFFGFQVRDPLYQNHELIKRIFKEKPQLIFTDNFEMIIRNSKLEEFLRLIRLPNFQIQNWEVELFKEKFESILSMNQKWNSEDLSRFCEFLIENTLQIQIKEKEDIVSKLNINIENLVEKFSNSQDPVIMCNLISIIILKGQKQYETEIRKLVDNLISSPNLPSSKSFFKLIMVLQKEIEKDLFWQTGSFSVKENSLVTPDNEKSELDFLFWDDDKLVELKEDFYSENIQKILNRDKQITESIEETYFDKSLINESDLTDSPQKSEDLNQRYLLGVYLTENEKENIIKNLKDPSESESSNLRIFDGQEENNLIQILESSNNNIISQDNQKIKNFLGIINESEILKKRLVNEIKTEKLKNLGYKEIDWNDFKLETYANKLFLVEILLKLKNQEFQNPDIEDQKFFLSQIELCHDFLNKNKFRELKEIKDQFSQIILNSCFEKGGVLLAIQNFEKGIENGTLIDSSGNINNQNIFNEMDKILKNYCLILSELINVEAFKNKNYLIDKRNMNLFYSQNQKKLEKLGCFNQIDKTTQEILRKFVILPKSSDFLFLLTELENCFFILEKLKKIDFWIQKNKNSFLDEKKESDILRKRICDWEVGIQEFLNFLFKIILFVIERKHLVPVSFEQKIFFDQFRIGFHSIEFQTNFFGNSENKKNLQEIKKIMYPGLYEQKSLSEKLPRPDFQKFEEEVYKIKKEILVLKELQDQYKNEIMKTEMEKEGLKSKDLKKLKKSPIYESLQNRIQLKLDLHWSTPQINKRKDILLDYEYFSEEDMQNLWIKKEVYSKLIHKIETDFQLWEKGWFWIVIHPNFNKIEDRTFEFKGTTDYCFFLI